MTKFVSLAPFALVVFALGGCSHHASTAVSVAPDSTPSAGNTNTFGDDKTQATGDAEHARDQSIGSSTPSSPAAPQSAEPKTPSPK